MKYSSEQVETMAAHLEAVEREARKYGVRYHALDVAPAMIRSLLAERDALRIGMDEALFALYPHQPAVARELRMKYLPERDGDKHG